ncbi:MAG: DUF2461 domain-containing protein [Bacteroidales bacterium]|nr:DUF2461 domain-containing protein [Bacteroidales bacterium]
MEEILTFLNDVLHNNNRPWFQEHKKQYQTAQANFNALAEQIIAGVQKFDDNCKGLTLKDCTYHFYRDTRFSPDKRPYKTHFGVFVCPEGKKSMLSGYYFHLEAKESEYLGHNMLCTGMYMPDTTMLKTIRDEILFNGQPLVEAIAKAKGFDLDTRHAMKRVPNGYPKDHPLADLFKQRDWLVVQDLPDKRLSDPHLVDWVLSEFEKTKDFCQWLNRTVRGE